MIELFVRFKKTKSKEPNYSNKTVLNKIYLFSITIQNLEQRRENRDKGFSFMT